MNTVKSPLVREHLRSEREITSEVISRLEKHGFASVGADPLKDGLVQVFARYCQILTERLNQIPESHHHAFISMLGAAPAPAIPARVPLSFTPVGSVQNVPAVVPKFTQVAAPAENGSEAVIFETPNDLPLVQAELKRAIAVDTRQMTHADVSGIVSTEAASRFTQPFLLAGAVPLERAMHISQPKIIGLEKISRLRLNIDLEQAAKLPPNYEIEWGIQSEKGFAILPPESDATGGLVRSGELVFIPPKEWPSRTITDVKVPWLTCRLRPSGSPGLLTNADANYSGTITRIEISGYTRATAIPPAGAFNGGIPLDVSRDFFPLGERPRFGEVFYILSESFALPEARVVIDIKLTNPAEVTDSPIPPVSRKGNPRVRWEAYTKRGWVLLDCIDDTRSLTQDGEIELLIPADAESTVINAITGGWVRARLVGGHYAADNIPESAGGFSPANPPSIATIQLTSVKEFGPLDPERLVIESGLEYLKVERMQLFKPFPVPTEQKLMLYLMFEAREEALAGRTLNLYSAPCNEGKRTFCRDCKEDEEEAKAAPRWQSHTKTGWRECAVISDSTRGLRDTGIIELQIPANISEWRNSTVELKRQDPKRGFFWVRIALDIPVGRNGRERDQLPCLRRLSLNTILATQTLRLTDELLGSSNGRPKQIFHTLHKPIIGGVELQVRELRRPADGLSETWPSNESLHSFGSMKISTLPSNEVWIPWFEVEDFSASDSHSRHYILDRLTGSIRFGDGRKGHIPPPGANNIRLPEYHTGGGRRGNLSAGKVAQLRTTIPYVDSARNLEPARGGQDQESPDSLSRGATAWLRHRGRAISMDDYAELARKASPEVAQAACVSARDLLRDPREDKTEPGVVSVIVAPHSAERRPRPSLELLKNVRLFLDTRRPIGVDLIVLEPEYVSIDVVAEIVWGTDYSMAGALAECEKQLDRFLHPVTGGMDGQGWRFGDVPHTSDIYPLLGAIEGLDHIRSLELHSVEDRPGLLSAQNFLICSGTHEIHICRHV